MSTEAEEESSVSSMHYKWSHAEETQIVNYYRENELLWRPDHPDYFKRHIREACLSDLAKSIGDAMTVELVKKKFTNLRTYYKKQLGLERAFYEHPANAGRTYSCSWLHFEGLDFLRNAVAELENSDGIVNGISYETEDGDEFEGVKNEGSESRPSSDKSWYPSANTAATSQKRTSLRSLRSNAPAAEPTSKNRDAKRNAAAGASDDDEISAKAPKIASLQPDRNGVYYADDDCSLFGKQVALELRQLKGFQRDSVKIKISQLLFEAKYGRRE